MKGEIVRFVTERPEAVLETAKGWDMERCIILGWKGDGTFCFGGSFSELGEIILLLRAGEHHLMTVNSKMWAGP